MPFSLLAGVKVIEVSAFIAAPLAGLTLAQLGAEVVRIDPVGGGIDAKRWPLSENGTSLYWSGLNRAKSSLCLDLKSDEGIDALGRLIGGDGPNDGILLTNLAGLPALDFETLRKLRPDLIFVELNGHHDGETAVDYTVNAAVGVPYLTGPEDAVAPMNNQLPAWDAAAGLSLSTAVLAALHRRAETGEAQHVSVSLSDVAYAFLGNTGVLPEAELTGRDRPRLGNHVYGAFGHDLPTADGRRIMIVAITPRHWRSLMEATRLAGEMAGLEAQLGLDFGTDAGRYLGRHSILELLAGWSQQHTLSDLIEIFGRHQLLFGPYRTTIEMLAEDPRASTENPMFQVMDHTGVGRYRVPGSPIRPVAETEGPLSPPPAIGQDTREVLASVGYSDDEIDRLIASGRAGQAA